MEEKRLPLRQGDVLLIPVDKIPHTPAQNKILALGEATGHRHEILNGNVMIDENDNLFVEANDETVLSHHKGDFQTADHKEVKVPAGNYEVRIQREYEPDGWRRVAD